MNLSDFYIETIADKNRVNIFLNDAIISPKNIPFLIEDFNQLIQLISKKLALSPVCVDLNNYRLEREKIIIELAKAAARKALMTKNSISLPIMNSYERRLIHTELAVRPDIKTESEGEGKNRHVIIKPILE